MGRERRFGNLWKHGELLRPEEKETAEQRTNKTSGASGFDAPLMPYIVPYSEIYRYRSV